MTTKQQPTVIGRMADEPEYQAAFTRLSELQVRRDELDRAINRLNSQISDSDSGAAATSRLHQAAVALIEGQTAAEATPDDLRRDADDLRKELRVVRAAIEIQEKAVAEARRQVSQERLPGIRERYKEIVARIDAALTDLKIASLAEQEFREAIVCADWQSFGSSLRSLSFMRCESGPAGASVDRISAWKKEAAEAGLL